jgi:hypothetical protein
MLKSNDTAFLVTTYCGDNDPPHMSTGNAAQNEQKRYMTKTLLRHLRQTGYYICCASHSTLDRETQEYCDMFIYDKDNSYQINGQPLRPNHGVAELISMVNGLLHLKVKGYDRVMKICYDQIPDYDYESIIKKYQSIDCDLVSCANAFDLGTLFFYGKIDFILDTLPIDELWRLNAHNVMERAWREKVVSKNLLHRVHAVEHYEHFFNLPYLGTFHYVGNGGIDFKEYKF